MASNRPDDLGQQFPSDTNDVTPPDPTTGRSQIDYTTGKNPVSTAVAAAATGDEDADPPIQQFLLKGIGEDTITCISVADGVEQGLLISIAKPWHLRQSIFDVANDDSLDIGEFEATYDGPSERVLENLDGAKIFQRVVPPYVVDEDIIYAGEADNTNIAATITLVDLNAAGRKFETYGERQYLLKEVNDDTLTCVLYENGVEEVDGNGDPVLVTIAKPDLLRRTPFDGLTVNGVTYTYTDPVTRKTVEGGVPENEVVTPAWEPDFTIIYAGPVNASGLDDTLLLDGNHDNRRWEFAGQHLQFSLTAVKDDYIECVTLDGAGALGVEIFYIMKPWILRRTPFEGPTVNGRTYTYSSDTEREDVAALETQQITQDYFVGAVIIAYRVNVIHAMTNGKFTNLIDANGDSRAWCEPE